MAARGESRTDPPRPGAVRTTVRVQGRALPSEDLLVRRPSRVSPLARLFFVPFPLTTSFTVLNLFIGIIVDAMQAGAQEELDAEREKAHADAEMILSELRVLRQEVASLKSERQK